MRLAALQTIGALFLVLLGCDVCRGAGDEGEQQHASVLARAGSRASYRIGLECARREELGVAQRHFTRAIRLDRRNILAFLARANVRALRGDLTGALGDADHAIHLKPAFALAYFVRAQVYARERLWTSATDDYTAAAFLEPHLRTEWLFSGLGIALTAQGRFAEAVTNFTRAISRSTAPAEHYFHRSYAYERQGQLEAAISDLNATLQASPKHAEVHHRRAVLFLRKGMDQQALLDLTAALENNADDLRALADRASLHQRLGDRQAAAADLARLARDHDAENPILGGDDHWAWPW